jgi:hypothetical protein
MQMTREESFLRMRWFTEHATDQELTLMYCRCVQATAECEYAGDGDTAAGWDLFATMLSEESQLRRVEPLWRKVSRFAARRAAGAKHLALIAAVAGGTVAVAALVGLPALLFGAAVALGEVEKSNAKLPDPPKKLKP